MPISAAHCQNLVKLSIVLPNVQCTLNDLCSLESFLNVCSSFSIVQIQSPDFNFLKQMHGNNWHFSPILNIKLLFVHALSWNRMISITLFKIRDLAFLTPLFVAFFHSTYPFIVFHFPLSVSLSLSLTHTHFIYLHFLFLHTS